MAVKEVLVDDPEQGAADDASAAMDVPGNISDIAIAKALGEELRRAREARELSRRQLAECLPSGIGERTLLSYEHGTRHMTVVRLFELCLQLDVGAPGLLGRALQRARIDLESVPFQVDLRGLQGDTNTMYGPVGRWARNKLDEAPGGIAELPQVAVSELAVLIGCSRSNLVDYLAQFTPSPISDVNGSTECD